MRVPARVFGLSFLSGHVRQIKTPHVEKKYFLATKQVLYFVPESNQMWSRAGRLSSHPTDTKKAELKNVFARFIKSTQMCVGDTVSRFVSLQRKPLAHWP